MFKQIKESALLPNDIAGIFHVAGVLDDATLLEQDIDKYDKVASPKVQGAYNLQSYIEKENMKSLHVGKMHDYLMFMSNTNHLQKI